MIKIAIIDYGMGNTRSIINALEVLGVKPFVSACPHTLKQADAYILPGVGAFPQAMANFHQRGLQPLLEEQVQQRQKPLLGICLGMHLLAENSEEQGMTQGLNWISGHVVALTPKDQPHALHVGWNHLHIKHQDPCIDQLDAASHFYFDHGYRFVCTDPEAIIATSNHTTEIVAIVRKGPIFATQFHPEKSQRSGLLLLRNWLQLAASHLPH